MTSKVDWALASQMRAEGKTYEEIGKYFGVSKQYIQSMDTKRQLRRHNAKVYENIPYRGLKKYFAAHERATVPKLTYAVMGYCPASAKNKMIGMLEGRDVSLRIGQIKKLCSITGMTFEELFFDERGHVS